jgi:hypothetical protein
MSQGQAGLDRTARESKGKGGSCMDLIDRYIDAVLRLLPQKLRHQSEAELRSRISGDLAKKTAGKPASDADIEAVLTELGDPRKVAGQYGGAARSLIGPALIDPYWLALRIVLAAVAVGILISFAVQLAADPAHAGWQMGASFLSDLYTGLISAFGLVTLIFALIQHYNPQAADVLQARFSQWKPSSLPPARPDTLRIKRGEAITAIIFSGIALIIVNIALAAIGLYIMTPSGFEVTPLFSSRLQDLLPLIDISLALAIVLEICKLVFGRWNVALILGAVAQKIFALVVGLRVFADSAIFNPAFFSRVYEILGSGHSVPGQLPARIAQILTILVIIGFVADLLALLGKAFRLTRGRQSP